MPKNIQRSILYKELDLSKHICPNAVLGEENRAQPFFDIHPFPLCMFYVQTASLDRLHVYPYIRIWYVKSGSFCIYLKGRKFTLNKGAMIIVPPYIPHYIDSHSDSVSVCCEFSENFIIDADSIEFSDTLLSMFYLESALIAADWIEPYCYFPDDAASELETVLDKLCSEFSKRDQFSEFFVRSNLIRLLALVGKAYNISKIDDKVSKHRESLNFAIKYINENFEKKLYLKDVCQKAMMDRSTFGSLFKMLMRMPFSQYVQYVRVLRAQELLAETDKTQLDIAVSCGFHSVSFLHKTFKHYIGVLPGEYRRNMKRK